LVHVENPGIVVKNLTRVLKKGGLIVIDGNSLLNTKVIYSVIIGKVYELYNKIKSRPTESSKVINKAYFPFYYGNILKRHGCEIKRILADTLFVVDIQIPLMKVTFPFKSIIPFLRIFDKMSSIKPFCYFGYEVWFLARKEKDYESKAV
jgi:hypothetical protein